MFVRTHQVDGYGPTVPEGGHTFGVGSPDPEFAASDFSCCICADNLEQVTNARRLKIHRVAKVFGPTPDGETPFLGSLFPWQTHDFHVCRRCKIGYSMLKHSRSADAVDPHATSTGKLTTRVKGF